MYNFFSNFYPDNLRLLLLAGSAMEDDGRRWRKREGSEDIGAVLRPVGSLEFSHYYLVAVLRLAYVATSVPAV